MKRLLFILLLLPLFVRGQGGYSPTTPTGSTSFSPTFRYKTHVTDSTLYIWLQANGHWYPISTVGLSGGGGGSFLPLAGGIMTGKQFFNTTASDSLGVWWGNGAHGVGSDRAGIYLAQPTTDHSYFTSHLDDNAHLDFFRWEINTNSSGGPADNHDVALLNLDKFDVRSDSVLFKGIVFRIPNLRDTTVYLDSVLAIKNGDVYKIKNGKGTVTAIGVTSANGVSGTSSGGATPNLMIALGNITPTSVASAVHKPSNTYQTPAGTAGTDSVVVKTSLGLRAISPAYYATSSGGLASTNFVYNETPSGTINGTNVTFTLANTPTKVELYKSGVHLSSIDYTISGNTITYAVPPNTVPYTDVLLATYIK